MQRIYQAALAAAIALAAYAPGGLERLERGLLDLRFQILDRPASGDLVVVQIDARSLGKLETWPLPRNSYAFAVRALDAAGAREIAIDVDMSGRSDPAGTAALASALADAGGHVILPAFTQQASPGDRDGGLVDAQPEAGLAPHVWLGSVNVMPDGDGQVRRLLHGLPNAGGEFRYSMFALLAGRVQASPDSFYVDYGIDVRTIPRISFVDVLEGNFDVGLVDGRRVIIGGTAVELGDHFSVPRFGVMSGPMVQAMGFETLHQKREILRTGPAGVVLVVLAIVIGAVAPRRRMGWRIRVLAGALGVLLLFILSLAAHEFAGLFVDAVPGMLACIVIAALQIVSFADIQQRTSVEQRRLAAHQRLIRDRVISDSSDGIAVFSDSGKVELTNARVFTLCGAPDPDADLTADTLLAGLDFEEDMSGAGWRGMDLGISYIASRQTRGGTRHLELVLNRTRTPGRGNGDTQTVTALTVRDVTDRMHAIAAERRAREEAERASRAKTDFLASMSHELRTPLNAIIGFSDLMAQEIAGPLGDPAYKDYVNDIANGGRHLLAIINDILDISRIEMGDLDIAGDEVSLAEAVEGALGVARGDPTVAACRIETHAEPGLPAILGDARRIQQSVINLVSNAAKFSPAGSVIRIALSPSAAGGAVVSVTDNGCGIPKNMRTAILMPFQQVKSAMNRSGEGVGLGLSLVAAYMKLHGGTVEIDSVEGEGTTVRLVFPPERAIRAAA